MDYLDTIAQAVRKDLQQGYYRWARKNQGRAAPSLVKAILENPDPVIIAEIKPATPSDGILLPPDIDLVKLGNVLLKNGAVALSVLTARQDFHGNLDYLAALSRLGAPLLMKDFILSTAQIEAGAQAGASAILLIMALFENGYPDSEVDDLIEDVHRMGLEVVLEVHTIEEYQLALLTKADLIGINNRNLRTLDLDLDTTRQILHGSMSDRPVISMSGITEGKDIAALQAAGCTAVLIGSSLMKAPDPGAKIRSLLDEACDTE